jgi:hypothetical protein
MTGAWTAARLLSLVAGSLSWSGGGPPDPAVAGGTLRERIGVFLRCTGREDPEKGLQAVRTLGLDRVQVSRLPDRFYTAAGASEFTRMLKATGIRADAVVVVFEGESYEDRDSVMRTVGLRPVQLRSARLAYAKKCIDFSAGISPRTTLVGSDAKSASERGGPG